MSILNNNSSNLKLQISTDDDSSQHSQSEPPSDSSACNSNRGSFNSSSSFQDLKLDFSSKNTSKDTSTNKINELNLNFDKLKSAVVTPKPVMLKQLDLKSNKISTSKKISRHPVNTNGNNSTDHFQAISEKVKKITISPTQVYEFNSSDFKEECEIGRGEFGVVYRVLHTPSKIQMAVKKIRSTVDQNDQLKLIKELNLVIECKDSPFTVKLYGVKFNTKEGDCQICMELMDTSFDKFYKHIYDVEKSYIPENILLQVTLATLHALNQLKENYKVIHRDVKPSNILLNRKGEIKICDFGISGKLVDSMAKSSVGCKPYMAPERIDPTKSQRKYDVRSDVWSFGITLCELALGKFPYPHWENVFQQLESVVNGRAPQLEPNDRLSKDFCDFVNTCLIKDENERPKYKQLLEHTLVYKEELNPSLISEYANIYLDKMNEKRSS